MKHKIKEAIETTLVVENKQSIDLCVDKIFNSIQEQKQSDAVESKLWDELFKIAWSPDNYTSDSEKIIKEKFHISNKTK